MARRHYTHKERLRISNFMVIVLLVLCFLIFDNWLGITLSKNDVLLSYTGKCVKYQEMPMPKKHGNDTLFSYYDIYMDNGLILSVHEECLWDAGFHKYELTSLLEQELTVYYYPGILPIPPARLIGAFLGDREIVSTSTALIHLSNRMPQLFALMIVPGLWLIPDLFWKLFQSSFWQSNWPKIRKKIKQWRYRSTR